MVENLRFASEIPNADNQAPPDKLGLVAAEVGLGLQIVIDTIRSQSFPSDVQERDTLGRQMREAYNILKQFMHDIELTPSMAALTLGSEAIEADTLACLRNGPALYAASVVLEPQQIYPLNYWGEHYLASDTRRKHAFEGTETDRELFLGYLPPGSIYPESGFAVSVKQLLRIQNSGGGLSAIPRKD